MSKGHTEDEVSSQHTTLVHALELKPYIEEPISISTSTGFSFPDMRPQVRHDFVLSNRKVVDEYWNTLEYCYGTAKSSAALLAFPGCAVHEVLYHWPYSFSIFTCFYFNCYSHINLICFAKDSIVEIK